MGFMMHRFLLILATLFIHFGLSAQRILDFESLTIEDGLSSSKANAIIQDSKGYIWIGTWNGLNRYDGYNCKVYSPSYRDTTSISNREIVSLIEDHNGNIWAGTTSGLNQINTKTGAIKKYPFKDRIISLYEDKLYNIWVGTSEDGLYKIEPATGKRQHFLPNQVISDIYEDSRNILWIATYEGLVHFDRNSGNYVIYQKKENESNSISHTTVTQIEEDKNGNLWVGTWGGGLNKVIVHPNMNKVEFVHYPASDKNDQLKSNAIYRLYYDAYDNLWIGSWDKGLSLLESKWQSVSPDKAKFYHYNSDLRNPYSISGNNITALHVDNSGVLWVGSSEINYAEIIKTGITRYNSAHKINNQFEISGVRAIAKKDDILYIGTNHELKLYRQKDLEYENFSNIEMLLYPDDGNLPIYSSIMSILPTSDGIWIGTDDLGVLYYDFKEEVPKKLTQFRNYTTGSQPSIPGNKVIQLYKSKKYPNTTWLGTVSNGMARLNIQNGQVSINSIQAQQENNALSNSSIRVITEDNDGFVWVGTQRGLNCYNQETNTCTKYFYDPNDSSSINDDVINCLWVDRNNNLWVGTNSGLNKKMERMLPNGIRQVYFKSYPDIEHLSNEIITNLLEDNSGNLWVGFYRGMTTLNIETETPGKQYYSKEYQHLKALMNTAFRTPNGEFFLGGSNGFINFHPDSLFAYSKAPTVVLTDLTLFNESIFDSDSRFARKYNMQTSLPDTKSLKLDYKDRYLTLTFSAMDYKDAQKNQYAYILEGFEDQWNFVGNRNSATYTNVSPGKYVFKVKAANSHGVWNETPTKLEIHISTPWWRSVVAYIFYVLLFIGILYFFKEYSIVEAKEKSRLEIEHVQNEKEHELNELKSQFFTNITHEFRTPLSLIMGPAEELLGNKELPSVAKQQAGMIQRNAQRLLRLVNQLMEFRKLEKGKMELQLKKCNISEMLNELYYSFNSMAASKHIEFSITLKQKEIIAEVDPDKFEKIMFNLLSNAFKYSAEGDKVTLRAGMEPDENNGKVLAIEVEDSGLGISDEHKEKVFERFYQVHDKPTQSTGGIGLFLSKLFVELHQGTIVLDSEHGKGSCFRITIPVQQPSNSNDTEALGSPQPEEANPPVEKVDIVIENQMDGSEWKQAKKPHILLVEDDVELNEFTSTSLQGSFKVSSAFHGKEGLELAKKLEIDIVVSDIMMPEMDGIELCRLLRNDMTTSHIPVVFLTAKTMEEDEVTGLKMGAVDYIHKPFNVNALKLKITNLLDSRNKLYEKIKKEQLLNPEQIELSSLDDIFLKKAVDAVDQNIDDPNFNMERFSEHIGFSSNQVYRKIKALTGQTANEFIRNQRLKTAASLLKQRKRSITEIIYMVGFSSPSYFSRCFKELYGCTPREYLDKEGELS